MAGIIGFGVYVPKYRIKKDEVARVWGGLVPGIMEHSLVGIDEDSITMAVEAGRNAIRHGNVEPSQIGALYVASVSSPYVSKSMATVIAEVLEISPRATVSDVGGSSKSGTAALLAALDTLRSGRAKFTMVIGSDFQVGTPGDMLEHSLGAGAAAFVLGNEGTIADIEDVYSVNNSFTNSWRNSGERFVRRHDDVRLEREFGYPKHTAEAARGLLQQMGRKPADYRHLALHQPDGQLPGVVAKSVGFKPDALATSSVAPSCGDTGSGSALMALASALDMAHPGERVLGVSYGSGAGSDAISVLVTGGITGKRARGIPLKKFLDNKEYVDYVTYQKFAGTLRADVPVPISSYGAQPGWEREKRHELLLRASKCKRCGSLNFPRRFYCLDCRGEDLEEVHLPRTGKVTSFNVQYVAAVWPEEAPIPVCIARMDGAGGEYGGNVSGMMCDCSADEVRIGMAVELVFRRCGEELGLVKYGYKFRPTEGERQSK